MKKLLTIAITIILISAIAPSFFISNIKLAHFYNKISLNKIINKLHTMLRNYKYFKLSEFDSPDLKNSGWFMKHEFVKILDQIREEVGFPIVINRGFSTHKHNTKVGGKENSAHKYGIAADLQLKSVHERDLVIAAAFKLGIRRIGIMNKAVHLDIGDRVNSLWGQAIWFYDGRNPQTLQYLVNNGYVSQETFNKLT